MNKKGRTQSGITLIALVITIIVMLILVAVTINMAVNGELFDYAGKAVGETQDALDAEKELSNGKIQVDGKWYASIDDYIKGKVELPEGIKVGDYVNYTPTTGIYKVADGEFGSGYTTEQGYQSFTTETGDAALKWRILSIDEQTGEIELVSETAAQVSTPLYLNGADGYNHAVDILNDLCETLYSNKNGAIARSIKVEDIDTKTTYDYETFESTTYGYNDTKKLSEYGAGYMNYPSIYSQEVGYGTAGTMSITGLNGSEGKKDRVTDANGVTTYSTVTGSTDGNTVGTDPYVTYTHYSYTSESYLEDLGVNTATAGLLNTGKAYWLASRSVGSNLEYAYFGVRFMNSDGGVGHHLLFYSNGSTASKPNHAVRPVVSLGTNVTLIKDTTNSTEDTIYWNIEF